jgi:hypothetical protein
MYDRNGPESRHVSNGVMIGLKNPANLGRPLWPCSTISFLLHFGFMKSLTFHNFMLVLITALFSRYTKNQLNYFVWLRTQN